MRKASQHFLAGAAFIIVGSTSVGAMMSNTVATAATAHEFIATSLNFDQAPIAVKNMQLADSSSGGFHPFRAIGNFIGSAFHAVTSVVKNVVHTVSNVVHAVSSVVSAPFKAIGNFASGAIHAVASTVGSLISSPIKILGGIGSVIHNVLSGIGSTVDSVARNLVAPLVSTVLPISETSVDQIIDAVENPGYVLTHPFHDFNWLMGGTSFERASDYAQTGLYDQVQGLTFSLPGVLTPIFPQPVDASIDYFNILGLLNWPIPIPGLLTHYKYLIDSKGDTDTEYYGTLNLLEDAGDGLISGAASGIAGAVEGAIKLGSAFAQAAGNLLFGGQSSSTTAPTTQSAIVTPTENTPLSPNSTTKSILQQETVTPPRVSLLN